MNLNNKKRELFLYLFWGVMTTIINIVSLWFFNVLLGVNLLVSNTIAWFLSVLVAFLTNRIWVFHSPTNTLKEFFVQMFNFFVARIATLLIENAILWIFVDYLGLNMLIIKIIACIVVVILNYVFSKLIIFRHKKTEAI
ncbi:MAG: GtrA family protein [Inconstantimicrobium porci]|uniref:GtrA family protein n=1 Tax=Inconstantimicrobium porci TaxID=2652291 RepID=UPI002A9105C0|nr:GtrA family protein [Inconstantimicrobium porci]MDY5911189.1 GtrA family protein [Inconstantimicrobium porci]